MLYSSWEAVPESAGAHKQLEVHGMACSAETRVKHHRWGVDLG